MHSAVDGILAVGKLLELLALRDARLSEVIAALPPFFTAATQVEVTWDSKGRIMRCLLEQFAQYRTETVDGIKIYLDDQEWVLIRPDADRAIFHVVAEARSSPAALALLAQYSRLLTGMAHSACSASPRPPEPPSRPK
jgi:mannose-1-phosphate guanylyltransferase / phosphomannomutase